MNAGIKPNPSSLQSKTMIQYVYLGRVGYDEGLRLQAEVAGLVAEGRAGNVLLLLEHPPVLTLGRNAKRENILASDEMLKRRGVTVHEINRGGDVTYHGPGQLVGYPIFDLRTLRTESGGRMGPVDFVRGMEEALIRLCGDFGVRAGRICGLTGVWCGGSTVVSCQLSVVSSQGGKELRGKTGSGGTERKIGAIGIHVARGITSHGFAFNVTTDLKDFDLIVPCGISDHAVTSLVREVENPEALPTLEEIARQAAREFGEVFGEQVVDVESLADLREQAAKAPARIPAEDTPLRVPDEVKRLSSTGDGPIRA
ncbi:MAG TPA: lipoyl(octanoyl) transferase LipB [Terracidiphilus sp.]|nr:lipoyl(octanoyl) transferase LipB [Terracidiphilus sp.]